MLCVPISVDSHSRPYMLYATMGQRHNTVWYYRRAVIYRLQINQEYAREIAANVRET